MPTSALGLPAPMVFRQQLSAKGQQLQMLSRGSFVTRWVSLTAPPDSAEVLYVHVRTRTTRDVM